MAVNMSLKVLVVVTALLLQTARAMVDYDALWRDYNHVPTPCESASCMAGGCLYENCDKPVSCRGGMCFFRSPTFSVRSINRNCEEAVCEGGVCVFDRTAKGSCPGGACKFQNMATTLAEGYCTGGACMLEDKPHPNNLAAQLSE